MDISDPQPTPQEPFRVLREDGWFRAEVLIGGAWSPLYLACSVPVLDADYELGNWYVSTHPQSRFRQNLIVARTTREARYALFNGRYTVRRSGAEPEQRRLDADGLETILGGIFGLSVEPEWRPVLEHVAALPD